jgi:hypothetical protein
VKKKDSESNTPTAQKLRSSINIHKAALGGSHSGWGRDPKYPRGYPMWFQHLGDEELRVKVPTNPTLCNGEQFKVFQGKLEDGEYILDEFPSGQNSLVVSKDLRTIDYRGREESMRIFYTPSPQYLH